MLRAAAHGLDGAPHVATFGQQVPSSGFESVRVDAPTLVDGQRGAGHTVLDDAWPYHIAITANDRVRTSPLVGFIGEQRRVNAAKHDPGAACARHLPDCVPTQRIAGVNADAHHVSW